MIIPVRCFTCGKVYHSLNKVIGNKWNKYLVLLSKDISVSYIKG